MVLSFVNGLTLWEDCQRRSCLARWVLMVVKSSPAEEPIVASLCIRIYPVTLALCIALNRWWATILVSGKGTAIIPWFAWKLTVLSLHSVLDERVKFFLLIDISAHPAFVKAWEPVVFYLRIVFATDWIHCLHCFMLRSQTFFQAVIHTIKVERGLHLPALGRPVTLRVQRCFILLRSCSVLESTSVRWPFLLLSLHRDWNGISFVFLVAYSLSLALVSIGLLYGGRDRHWERFVVVINLIRLLFG